MVLLQHYGPPGSILAPSSLNNRFRALKSSAFERELNFKKKLCGVAQPSKYVSSRKLNLNFFCIW